MQSHIKKIECGISHSLHKSCAQGRGGTRNKAPRHSFCAAPRQPKPSSPSLLCLRGSNMFNTEHIESDGLFHNIVLWTVSSVNLFYSAHAFSHSYPWGIKGRNRVTWWIIQKLIRFSYQPHQEDIITKKTKQVQASKISPKSVIFCETRKLSLSFCIWIQW